MRVLPFFLAALLGLSLLAAPSRLAHAVSANPEPVAAEARIDIVRTVIRDNSVVGDLYVNSRRIGSIYENNRMKISAGSYQGLLHYVSGRYSNVGAGALGRVGDFVLEVGGRSGPLTVLLHGGNQPYQSRGCLMVCPYNWDSRTPNNSGIGDHPLNVLRQLFYGARVPDPPPSRNIVLNVFDPEQRWRSAPAATSVRFGGAPYCSYQTDISNISVALSTRGDAAVSGGTVQANCVERALTACRGTVIAPNRHDYVLSGGSWSNGIVKATFRKSGQNAPTCTASFVGRPVGNTLQGTLTIQRTDVPAPLNWAANVAVTLVRE